MVDYEDRTASPQPVSSTADDRCDICALARAGQRHGWNWLWAATLQRSLCFCPECSQHHLTPVPAEKPRVKLEDVIGAPKKGEA